MLGGWPEAASARTGSAAAGSLVVERRLQSWLLASGGRCTQRPRFAAAYWLRGVRVRRSRYSVSEGRALLRRSDAEPSGVSVAVDGFEADVFEPGEPAS